MENGQVTMAPKKAALVLIAKAFGMGLKETKEQCEALTPLDRQQLGSAAARALGLTADECNFALVEY